MSEAGGASEAALAVWDELVANAKRQTGEAPRSPPDADLALAGVGAHRPRANGAPRGLQAPWRGYAIKSLELPKSLPVLAISSHETE